MRFSMKKHYLAKSLMLATIMFFTAFSTINAQSFTVDAPMSIAGDYNSAGATFGPQFSGFSGMVVPATDVDGMTTACVGLDNGVADVTGAVALVDRGGCPFVAKAQAAQDAGAIAAIICNNDMDNPDDVIVPGGNDGCAITIPTLMLSFNDCQTIRMETGVTVTYTAPGLPDPGTNFATAIDITDGTYTIDSLYGGGGIFANSTSAAWYTYTPTADGVLVVSSCGTTVDTRAILGVSPGGCVGDVQLVAFNDDAGDACSENPYASIMEVLVFAGQEYLIIFDDPWSTEGFDFTVELQSLPTVPITFTVNMEQETVSPDGVNMVFASPGVSDVADVSVVALSDNGDGTWSGTADLMTLDTIGYAFVNGAIDPANVEAVPDACGLLNSFGFNIRPFINTSIVPAELAPVCFSLCTNCPVVNVTYTVDMTNEGASPDGVSMLVGGPGVTEVGDVELFPMTDNMDGTWSVTIERNTGDTLGYVFLNGALDPANLEMVPEECGLPSGFGFNIRPQIVEGFEDFAVAPVCFSTCTSFCPAEGCEEPATVMENMDNYELGADITTQSDIWVLWPAAGVIGGFVSDEQAASPPHSVKLEGGGSQAGNDLVDPLLNLGGVSSGAWDIRLKMYVPEGGSGYYNIQNNEGADPTQWNVEVGFEADGTLGVDLAGAGEYPQGEWFDIVNIIDVTNQRGEIIINGQSVYTWTYGPDWSIGAFNFFPRSATELYYVDDVIMRPIVLNGEDCPEGSIICDGLESYNDGPVSDQSSHWGPWTSSPADDGIVTEEQAFEGCNSLKITDEDPDDQLLLLGDRTEGNYLLEWKMYVPDGSLGYYNLQKFQDSPGDEFGMQVEFFADGTATLDAGTADVVTFNWTADTWQTYQHFIDLDNDWMTMVVDGVEIFGWPFSWTTFTQTGTKQLGSIDFFGNTDCVYYLDNVLFQQLPSLPGNLCGGAIDIQENLGGGVGSTTSTGPYDNTNYTTTSQDPDFGWECFGEPDGTGGAPSLERTMWYTFTGDGEEYFIEAVACGDDPIDFGDTQMAIYTGDCGNLESVLCVDDGPNAMAGGPFPAGDTLQTVDGQVYYIMVDGFGPDFPADGEYCMEFTQLSESIATVEVTFQVDATILVADGELAGDGMFIAGSFSDFNNVAMTEGADNIWTVTIEIEEGTSHEYKFKNGADGWENIDTSIGDDCTVGGYGNRAVDVGDMNMTLDVVCFAYCVTCVMVDVDEASLEAGVSVFPNPAKDMLNVQIDLPEAAQNLNIRLVNTFGQVVSEQYLGQLQSDMIELDLSKVPAGAYMLQVRDGQSQYTQSIVVQK
jgi:hypothetical protein